MTSIFYQLRDIKKEIEKLEKIGKLLIQIRQHFESQAKEHIPKYSKAYYKELVEKIDDVLY